MTPAEQTAFAKGVNAVLAIADATATQLESSPLPILRRELAIETLRAIVEEGRALLTHSETSEKGGAHGS